MVKWIDTSLLENEGSKNNNMIKIESLNYLFDVLRVKVLTDMDI